MAWKNNSAMVKVDVFQTITDKIITMLEDGTVPWRKTWQGNANGMPRNAVSGKTYRGINLILLAFSGYGDPRWVTFKQAKDLGGSVRKGEHGTQIIFWNFSEKENEDGEMEKRVFAKAYTVFNVSQCDNLKIKPLETPTTQTFNAIEDAEKVLENMRNKPETYHDGGDRAYYIPLSDQIHLPSRTSFENEVEYYATRFHEVTHSTGHASRCGRKELGKVNHFGDEQYSKEELVAEIGSAMLCAIVGIETPATLTNSAAYIASWLKALRGDKRLVVTAASQAQTAVDYILGAKFTESEEE